MEIITASQMLPMTNGCAPVADGAIAVELDKIHAVGTLEALTQRYPDAPVKTNPESILMPGLINAHSHLDLTTFYAATTFADASLDGVHVEFIDTLISSIDYKQETEPEKVMDGIQKGVTRLIETGVTCAGDMTHFEGTFKILDEMGLRAVIFPEILAGRGDAAQQRFEVALALLEKYTDDTLDRTRVGLGPYAPYLLSRNLLRIISRHAHDASIPLMIHAAESFAEMEFFFDSEGPIATDVFPALGWLELPPAQRKTPITYLADINFFDAPTIVVGGLHLSGNDFAVLARSLARVVWCPTMNAVMKHGKFPYAKLMEHGIPVGLGTEGWHTRLGFNLWEEMRTAMATEPSALTARDVVRMATVGSARALGLDPQIGTLEQGKKADYIVVRAPEATNAPNESELYEQLVKQTDPQRVVTVVVDGNILKSA